MENRVLVVDDEKLIVKGIVFSLEQDGMVTDAAYDGEEALDYLETGCYDVGVLDIMMPKMDGITVLKKLREKGNHIPVLVRNHGNYSSEPSHLLPCA